MDNIERIQIASLAPSYTKGKPPIQQPYQGKDAVIYLSPEYLRGGQYCQEVKTGNNAVFVDENDTIILWDGSNAGEIFLGRSGLLASTMSLIQHNSSFDKLYFFYALKKWEAYLKGQTSGSGIPHVDKEILGKLELSLFPLDEQKKIADILSTIDKAIGQTEALISKQQRIKTGLMQDLLTRGIDEHGNLRSEKTHKFKDSPLGRIPDNWEISKLDDLLLEKTYGISSSLSEEPKGIPVLRMNNLFGGEVTYSDLKYSNGDDAKKLILNDGDILFNRTNSIEYVGRTAIYRKTFAPVAFASYLVKLVTNRKKLDPEFLNFWLNYKNTHIKIKQLATIGVEQANINPTNLGLVELAFPSSVPEQNTIVNIMNTINQQLNELTCKKNKLNSLKKGLMQDLLTGKKRVTSLLQEQELMNI